MLAVCLAQLGAAESEREFTEIYHRCKREVYYAAWLVLRDRQLAEDILQDAFLSLAKNYAVISHDDPRKISRYLVISARTRAISLLNKRRHEIAQQDPAEALGDLPEATPESIAISAEQVGRLKNAIAGLSPLYRAPLQLLALGYTYAEIALALDLEPAAVRKRIERGRKYLLKELKADG